MRNREVSDLRETTLGQVLKRRSTRAKASDPLLSVTAERGVILQEHSGRRDSSSADKSLYLAVNSGDIVYNTMRMWQGVSGLSVHSGIVSPAYTVCTPTSDVNPEYMARVLKHPGMVARFYRASQGLVSDTWNLRYTELAKIPVTLPSLPEQRRISEILDTVDDQLDAAGRFLNKLAVGRRAAVHDAMRNALDELDRVQVSQVDGLIGKREGAWEFCTLGVQLKGIQAGNSPNLEARPAKDGEWGVLKVSSVGRSGFHQDENKVVDDVSLIDPSLEVRVGDLLMTRANTPELVGMTCVVDRTRPGLMLCDKTLRLQLRPEAGSHRFVNELLSSTQVRRQIEVAATGTSGSMKNISQGAIRRLVIPWATGEVQENIVRLVEAHDLGMRSTAAEVMKLRWMKQALMDDLLTGCVRVPVAP
ncbi:restriction endonuclease subunit S [Streptomyces sp. NBC_00597]|uniref:restriction endonuclease subunit S n=1 Tax=Streptomyces sp. NBC_00597 TaxID=2975786 RepID=UPI0030DF84FA